MPDFTYDSRDLEMSNFAPRYHEWILSFFKPYLGKKLAEVGAGFGNFTKLLLPEPFTELVAVEPSGEMYAALRAGVGRDPRVVSKNGFFPDLRAAYRDYFDTIMYVNVLEHVENDAAELRSVYESLAPGGYACVFVPALPGLMSEHDRRIGHFRRYTKRELVEKARAAGFEIARVRWFDIVGIIPWFFVFTLGKARATTGGALGLYDVLVVPVMRVVESLIPPPVGKNLLLIARKPASGSRSS